MGNGAHVPPRLSSTLLVAKTLLIPIQQLIRILYLKDIQRFPVYSQVQVVATITGLNRRTRIQYLVVTPKGIIETKILTFSCGGKGIFIQNVELRRAETR